MKKLSIIILVIILIKASSVAIGNYMDDFSALSDLSEIRKAVDTYKVEHMSERGFGNDRFDIYSFSLKEENDNDKKPIFKPCDKICEESYENFINFLETYEDKPDLKIDIEQIKVRKGTQYKRIKANGTEKLYLYNKSINKGYCIILTI